MAEIDVKPAQSLHDRYVSEVRAKMKGKEYHYELAVTEDDYAQWGSEFASVESFLHRAMELLLERVSPEELMGRLDVREARQLYPAFADEVVRVFGK
jgi:hypothetical protein